jgi:hypothetical protein
MTELDRMIKRAARRELKGYPGAIKLCDVYEFMAHLQRREWKALMPRTPLELLYMKHYGLEISIRWNPELRKTQTNRVGYCQYYLWINRIGMDL